MSAEGQAIREALDGLRGIGGPQDERAGKWRLGTQATDALEARFAEAERAAEWEQEHGGCECRTCLAALPSESGKP